MLGGGYRILKLAKKIGRQPKGGSQLMVFFIKLRKKMFYLVGVKTGAA